MKCTLNCRMNLGQANDAYEKSFQILIKVMRKFSKSQSFSELNVDSEFQIGLRVDSRRLMVRWRHLALVTEKLLLIVYIYQSCTIRHLDCHFGCVFAYACLLTLVELSLSHRLLSRPT